MARLCASLLLLWTLLVGPALCASGLLEHACDCGRDVQCQHEESCSQDPCPSPAPVDAGTTARAVFELPSVWIPVLTRSSVEAIGRFQGRAAERPPRESQRPNLPYAASDRPRRI